MKTQIWKTHQWPQDWKRSVFVPIPKKDKLPHNCTDFTIYQSNAQNSPSQALTVVNGELPDVHAVLRKGKGTRDEIANIHWVIKSYRVLNKHLLLLFWLCQNLWLWITTHCEKFWKRWEKQYLTCLLRNLYAGQEAAVRPRHETTDWLQIGKGEHQECILSPCLFNLYVEYIMWNPRLDEEQAGIKT